MHQNKKNPEKTVQLTLSLQRHLLKWRQERNSKERPCAIKTSDILIDMFLTHKEKVYYQRQLTPYDYLILPGI
jgi:hypothetical protein